jgi:two-component system OmpR family sensor kinase
VQDSLVSRLIWLLVSTLAGLWLLGSVTAGLLTVFEINERLDNALEEVAQRLLPATTDVLHEPRAMEQMATQLVATMDPRALAYQILDPGGHVAMRSANAPAAPFVLRPQTGFHEVPRYRVYTQPAAAGGYVIEVAEPILHRNEALRRAIGLAVLPLLFFLPLSWFLIRWAVHRSMRALLRLQQEIGQRDGSNLTRIPDLLLPRELVPIQTAVNRLLERLERALAQERQFAANSAHELRTPIAAVLAQLQVLSSQLVDTPQAERASRVVGQVKALGNLAEKLLQLSRTGAGLALKREPTDVMPVLQVLIDDFRRQDGVGGRLRLASATVHPFVVRADVDALGIAIRNLLENAVRYGAQDEPIEVVAGGDGRIHVLNGGPVVAAETLAILKEPFRRGTSLVPGGGLGLAIVENIMTQLGGRLVLASPATERMAGFEAVLDFAAAHVAVAPHREAGRGIERAGTTIGVPLGEAIPSWHSQAGVA